MISDLFYCSRDLGMKNQEFRNKKWIKESEKRK
jgi:hypothetical protein